jgi:hypothetical protein
VLGHEGLGEIKETGIRTVDCRETKIRVFAVLDRVPVAKRCRTVIAEAMPAKPACREGIWRSGCWKTSSAVMDASRAPVALRKMQQQAPLPDSGSVCDCRSRRLGKLMAGIEQAVAFEQGPQRIARQAQPARGVDLVARAEFIGGFDQGFLDLVEQAGLGRMQTLQQDFAKRVGFRKRRGIRSWHRLHCRLGRR